MVREPGHHWNVSARVGGLSGWIDDVTHDAYLLRLCISALAGDTKAREELVYLFPWQGDAPRERLEEVTAPEVRRLVQLVVAQEEHADALSALQHTIQVRAALKSATIALGDQADALGMLVEGA